MADVGWVAGALADAAARGEPAVLATVGRTEGSTYRRAGARMLVAADGRTVGAVSAAGAPVGEAAPRLGDRLLVTDADVVQPGAAAATLPGGLRTAVRSAVLHSGVRYTCRSGTR